MGLRNAGHGLHLDRPPTGPIGISAYLTSTQLRSRQATSDQVQSIPAKDRWLLTADADTFINVNSFGRLGNTPAGLGFAGQSSAELHYDVFDSGVTAAANRCSRSN